MSFFYSVLHLPPSCWIRRTYIKISKKKKESSLLLNSFSVGMTGLEPATSRPPDACANQLRYIPIDIKRKTNDRETLGVSVFATAKVLTYYENCKFSNIFFVFTDYICYFCTYNIYVRAKTKQPRNPIIRNL